MLGFAAAVSTAIVFSAAWSAASVRRFGPPCFQVRHLFGLLRFPPRPGCSSSQPAPRGWLLVTAVALAVAMAMAATSLVTEVLERGPPIEESRRGGGPLP